jgi:uncharacterized protein
MRKIKTITCIIGLFILFGGNAKNQETIVNYGIKLYDEGKYRQAVDAFLTIDENDSSYIRMLGELALTYIALEEYDSAILTCYKSLETQSSYNGHVYRTLATAYDENGDSENAIKYYKKAIKIIPYSHLNHYNLGYTYYQTENFVAAARCFQEAIRCNPFHSTSHLFLGILAARQGHLTKAMLSLETFLLLEPNSNRSNRYLVFLENIADGYVDTTYGKPIIPFWCNNEFIETDRLIHSRVVLDQNFPPVIDFNVSTVKQTQMLLEKMPLDINSNSFWVETYFPLFKAIKKNAALAPMLYVILRSTEADVVKDWTQKNEKKLEDFYKLGSELSYIKYYRLLETESGISKISVNYNDGTLVSVGNVDTQKNKQGQWKYFFSYGGLSAEGEFVDNEKNGIWTYYDWDGYIDFQETYVKGTSEGPAVKYHSNGNKRYELVYKSDKPEGKITFYRRSGVIDEIINYKDGVKHGNGIEFYPDGDTLSVYAYENGQLTGLSREFYSNNAKLLSSYYVNGKLHGKYREYYYNGVVRNEGEYNKGLKTGEWNYFFENGLLSSKDVYNDTVLKKVISYYRNGNKAYESNFNEKGNLNGVLTHYTESGSILTEETYTDDKLVKLVNYNADGTVRDEFGSPDLNFSIKTYYAEGQSRTEAAVKDGNIHGKKIEYWRNGNLKNVQYFENGNQKDVKEMYYQTGALKERTFESSLKEYYNYEDFYNNGSIKIKAELKSSRITEHYYYFLPNGDLFAKDYYVNSRSNGWRTYYGKGNVISYKEKFISGDEVLSIYYDDAGIAYDTLNFDLGAKYIRRGPDGFVESQAEMLDYSINDTLRWFYTDGSKLSSLYYAHGKRWGKYTKWYPSGQVSKTGMYANGDKHGLWIEFHENGAVSDSINYIFDDKFGKYVSYYDNGKIKYVANYKNDVISGEVIYYDYEGEPQVLLNYLDGELFSYAVPHVKGWSENKLIVTGNEKIISIFPNGRLAYSQQLINFVPHGEHYRFNNDGSKLVDCNYLFGELDGNYIEYYANGNVKREVEYESGMYNGRFKEFYQDGTLKEHSEYFYDDLNGIRTTYDIKGVVQNKEMYFDNRYMRKLSVEL